MITYEYNDTQHLLEAAKLLISDPKDWCQHYFATTINGTMTYMEFPYWLDPKAARFCALGALYAAVEADSVYHPVEKWLEKAIDNPCVGEYNNTHTHKEVLAMFDTAIELAADAE